MESRPESKENLRFGSLAEYALALGVSETPEMEKLRKSITELMRERKPFGEALGRYEDLAHPGIDHIIENEAHARAQIGLMVMKLSIYKDAGDQEAYAMDLNDTLDYAANMGFKDIEQTLYTMGSPENKMSETREQIKTL